MIGGGVISAVSNIALGADPAAISTWFFTAFDSIMARVSTGYAQSRRSGTEYLRTRATMAGSDVDVRAGSLSMSQARTSLEVTGPVAFKTAVAAGADDEEALLSMATQMSGSAQRLAIAGDRDVLEQTIAHGKGVVGYRRVLGGPGCGFCAMLASRGAVYLSRETASTTRSGLRFHDHCRCHVEPMFDHETDPPDVQRLQRQWQRITAGQTGKDKAVKWRNYWENEITDRSKLRLAAAKAGPPSPIPGMPHPAPGVVVRSGLEAKRSLTGLQEAWAAEAKRITGRNLSVDIPAGTSLQTAREYAEGVLRGLERFPDAAVSRIRFAAMAADQYAEAGSREITFNTSWASMRNRPELVSGLRNDIAGWAQGRNGWSTRAAGTPLSLSLHEFSHVLDIDNLGERIHSRALSLATRRAALEGIDVDDLIARDISIYATSSAHELVAESFTDVMLRGQAASPIARDIFDLLEAEYFKAGGRITPAFGTFAAKAAPNLAKMTVLQLRALAAERGVKIPSRALKADIVRALEDAPPGRIEPRAGIPKYEPPASLTAAERQRAARLVRADPQIFATVRERFGSISTSGNLSDVDAAWLQSIYEREPAFVNHLAQTTQIERNLRDKARQAGQTLAEYRQDVAARLKELLAGKPLVVRVTDDTALAKILADGRFKTQFDTGIRRTPGLEVGVERRRLGEQISGVAPDVPVEQRPVYGFVAVRGVEPALEAGRKIPGIAQLEGQEDILSAYGKVQVVLKPGVRSRTTATVGDSLDEIGFVRPSAIDSPTAESVGIRSLDHVGEPGWTRTGYVEAQIHGGVSVNDIEMVVFVREPSAALAEQLRARGIRFQVLRRDDAPIFPTPAPQIAPTNAARWLGNVDLPAAEAERIGQLVQAKSRRDILDEIVQLRAEGATDRALANRIRGRAALPNTYDVAPQVDNAFRDELLAAVDNGTIDDVVRRYLVALDVAERPLAKRTVAELRALAKERDITLPPRATKAQIVEALQAPPLTAAEKAAAERKALREAARERNRQIEQATGTARLLAEVDELLVKKAEARVIRQRLDPALIDAEQVFANADPAVREALAQALASGDMAKVRAAVTRLTTKAKIKVVGGKAGAKVKFDPATMESVGVEIADGAPVTVVTRGASVTLPDGSVVQVRKAQVSPVKANGRPPAKPVPIHDFFKAETTYAQIETAMRDVFEGRFGPYTTKIDVGITRAGTRTTGRGRVVEVLPSISISGKVYNSAGLKVGYFGRSIGPVDLHYGDVLRREVWAEHSIVQLDPAAQGKGFGGAFNQRVIQWYRESGVHGIGLSDHNGYTWASQGFGFAGGLVPDQTVDGIRDLIAALRAGQTKTRLGDTIPKRLREAGDLDRQIAEAEAVLDRIGSLTMLTYRGGPLPADYPTAYEISQIGRRVNQRGKTETWLGKEVYVPTSEMILNPTEGVVISGGA